MKRIFYSILAALLMLTLVSCGGTETDATTSMSENAPETAAVESAVPETDPAPDPFVAVRESREAWLAHGLAAYEAGKDAPDLSAFFSDMTNMTWLTLYDHTLAYDPEKAVPAAEALFRFITDNYGADALLDLEKRVEYKSAYLRSLGLDMDYLQTKEVEAFFQNMDFSAEGTTFEGVSYQYTMTFGNAVYYFRDFSQGPPTIYNGFLYYNTTGLWAMIDYLRENDLDEGLDTERTFEFYMKFDVPAPSVTRFVTGKMLINDSATALHEALHAMGVNRTEHLWLTEGICGYFGYILGFNPQTAASVRQILMKVPAGGYESRPEPVKYYAETVYDRYIAGGGSLAANTDVNLRLYYDVQARTDFEGNYNKTLNDISETISQTDADAEGGELTYNQARSLAAYLADTYGIQSVMTAYRTGDIEATFGKDYSSLKAAWMAAIGVGE